MSKKQRITIEVDSQYGAAAVGICRLVFPSLLESMFVTPNNDVQISQDGLEKMMEAMDDIYQSLAIHSGTKESAKQMMEACGVTEDDDWQTFFEKMRDDKVNEIADRIIHKRK